MRSAVNGGSAICPVAVPTFATPVIIPRRRTNQRAMVERVATSWVLIPTPMKEPEEREEMPGLADHRDEGVARAEEQPGPGKHGGSGRTGRSSARRRSRAPP